MDYYELIGVESTATTSEIKKAYRKKALICHPDKNLNNPRAAEIFKELGKALVTLTDVNARVAYDKVIAARKQTKKCIKVFDKRKKFKENLKAREEAYKRSLDPTYNDIDSSDIKYFRIKITWKVQEGDSLNSGYNYDNLYRMFSKYGDIMGYVMSTKKGRAIIDFRNKSAGETALVTEIGLAENPLTLCRLHGDTQKHSNNVASGVDPNIRPIFPMSTHSSSKPDPSVSFSSASDILTQERKMTDFRSSTLDALR